MTANPVELIGGLSDLTNVPKSDFIGWVKSRVPQVLADVTELRNTVLANQLVVILKSTGAVLKLDPTDTTTADDGITCVISVDGKRFKPLSSVPTPTTTSLGGVFSYGSVSHQWLKSLGTDGHFTSTQPAAADLSDGTTGSSGAVVLANGPTLGAITLTSVNKLTLTAPATGATLTLVDGTTTTGPATSQTLVGRTSTDTLTNKSIDASANTLTNLTTAMFAASVVDTDGTFAANSDTRLASQKATKTYMDQIIAAADAMVFKGVVDCSANPNYPAADRGWTYKVSVAGKIGGASGTTVDVGDTLLCITDGTASGTQASVGAQWNIVQANLVGAVTGPASSTSGNFASFNGTGGTVIQDSGKATPTGAVVGTTDAQTLTNKTITGGTADALTSLGIRSTGAAFDLKLASAEVLTANRTLTLAMGDAARTLTLGGNPTLNGGTHSGTNTGDQTITLTGDATGSGTGSFAVTIAANAVTLAKMAQVVTATFLGRTTASTGNVEALTVTQATALLNVMVGDSGSGGTKGLVPAPASGDSAAGKFLNAGGGYSVPAGGGGGGMSTNERQNFSLSLIYQAKAFAGYRRLIEQFADGYKASDGVNAGSSTNYTVDSSTTGLVKPTTSGGTYNDALGTQSTNGNSTGWGSLNLRQLIASAQLANVSGTLVRITLTPPSAGANTVISDCFIGEAAASGNAYDFDGSQKRVTFSGGSSGVTLTAGGSAVVSDSVAFTYTNTKNLVISFYFTSGDVRRNTSISGFTEYNSAVANEAGTTVATAGYSPGTSQLYIATRVEIGSTPTQNNMTVITTAQTADASVSNGRILIEYNPIDSITLNTDLTAEVTCDGGTHWAAATLSAAGAGQGGRIVAETADTAATAGTSFAARIKSLNNKNVQIFGTSLLVH